MMIALSSSSALSPQTRRLGVWALLLVALLALAVYANSLSNGFTLDDIGIVQKNPSVLNLEWSKIWVENYWPIIDSPPDALYRPLTIFSYLANQAVAPGNPWGFHAVNVALHMLISVMVALLAWRIFRHRALAVLAGILFALHPIHTEVVANVVGRAELLAAVWTLAALLIFLPTEFLLDKTPAPRSLWHGMLVAACLFAAMLSKETPLAMVAGFLFIDLWRWTLFTTDGPTVRPTFFRWMTSQILRYHLFLWIATAVYLALRIHAVGLTADLQSIHPVVNPLIIATIPERIVTPFLLLAKYLQLMVWPKILSSDYSAPSILPTANPFQPQAALGILLVAAALLTTITRWKRSPRIILLIALTVVSYLLVANIVRIGTIMGERLFYWPSVFISMSFACGAVWCWENIPAVKWRPVLRWSAASLATIALALLAARTVIRNPDWQSNTQMALATAQSNPDSAKACAWAGATLFEETSDPFTHAFGEQLLKRAITLYPEFGESYWTLAKYYGRQNRPGDFLIYFGQAAYHCSGRQEIRKVLTLIHEEFKQRPESEFMPAVNAYVEREPENPCAHFSLGIALWAKGKNDAAETQFRKAMTLAPSFDEDAAELGRLKLEAGDAETAVGLLKHYVLRIRFNGDARCQLAQALMALDPVKFPKAMAESDMNICKAETLIPNSPQVRAVRAAWARKNAALHAQIPSPIPQSSNTPENPLAFNKRGL